MAAPKPVFSFYCQKLFNFSTISALSHPSVAYNTSASLDKLTCTNYVEIGKCQDRFGLFPWFKKDSNYLDVKHKMFKGDNKGDFRLVQKLTIGKAK